MLKRLGISYKRGRSYVHSPDPDYESKLVMVKEYLRQARKEPKKYAVLFLDELSYYRQPTISRGYESVGEYQPLGRRSYRSDTCHRVIATLDALTGRVIYLQRAHLKLNVIVDFFLKVVEAYSGYETLYIVLDNWPVHFHPDVLAALQPQDFPWPLHCPSNWPTEPRPSARRLNLPIKLVQLPTYASWTNPIEKLWRKLKQELLHLHRFANRWKELREQVDRFLDNFSSGSRDLLRYVGLAGNSNFYSPPSSPPDPALSLPT